MTDHQERPPYLALPHDSVRLLILHQDRDSDDLISCDLISKTLLSEENHDKGYQCLSYTWDNTTTPKAIKINGRLFEVNQNLWEFLDMFRTQDQNDLPLWIDQICIGRSCGTFLHAVAHFINRREIKGIEVHFLNTGTGNAGTAQSWRIKFFENEANMILLFEDQDNLQERNEQVQQMGLTYMSAKKVVVWLGAIIEDEEDLVGSLFQELERQMLHPCGTDLCPLCSTCVSRVPGLERLSQRPYWTRIWVVQELVLGASVILFWGRQSTHMSALSNFLSRHQRIVLPDEISKELTGLDRVLTLCSLSTGSANSKLETLDWIIGKFCAEGECSEPRDFIYGLQGIIEPAERVKVDYGLAKSNVFGLFIEKHISVVKACKGWVPLSVDREVITKLSDRLRMPGEWRYLFPESSQQMFMYRDVISAVAHMKAYKAYADLEGKSAQELIEMSFVANTRLATEYYEQTGLDIHDYFCADTLAKEAMLKSSKAFEHYFETVGSISLWQWLQDTAMDYMNRLKRRIWWS